VNFNILQRKKSRKEIEKLGFLVCCRRKFGVDKVLMLKFGSDRLAEKLFKALHSTANKMGQNLIETCIKFYAVTLHIFSL
jgi:hypothetical protein